MLKQEKKYTVFQKIKILTNILLLMLFAYVTMVFISHFSVNHELETYSYIDSFKAIYTQTPVAKEFIIGFGLIIFFVVILALLIKLFFSLIKK